MPIYEYECRECGHQFEALQKVSDAPLIECPQCKQPQLRKKVSAAGFRLSGSGWYETDFKDKGQKNLARKEEATATTQESDKKPASEKKSESSAPSEKKANKKDGE